MSKNTVNSKLSAYKPFKINRFLIINNFNVFQKKDKKKKGIKLELEPTFESYTEFIDKYLKNKETTILNNKTYSFSLNFSKAQTLDPSINLIKNKDTIKLFNLKYKVRNNFDSLYSSSNSNHFNSYRILFKNRYSFPDFNSLENFILLINRKKNTLFEKTIEFFKTWTYQTIIYELKDKLLLYGYLPPGFNYTDELLFIFEILDGLNTKYEFLINNKSFKQSSLSLYSLPASDQFLEDNFDWNFNKYNLLMNINQKEEIITTQINQETKF